MSEERAVEAAEAAAANPADAVARAAEPATGERPHAGRAAESAGTAEAAGPTAPAPAPPADATAFLGQDRKLDRNWITQQRIGRWIGVGVLAACWAVASVGTTAAGAPAPVLLTLVGGLGTLVVLRAVLAQVWPAKAWKHASYRVSERGIEIRRGVWWRTVVTVPRSRVQHTDVTQGPLERSFGLGTLVLFTAGTDHSKVELPGLAYADASAIRDRLAAVDEDDAV